MRDKKTRNTYELNPVPLGIIAALDVAVTTEHPALEAAPVALGLGVAIPPGSQEALAVVVVLEARALQGPMAGLPGPGDPAAGPHDEGGLFGHAKLGVGGGGALAGLGGGGCQGGEEGEDYGELHCGWGV